MGYLKRWLTGSDPTLAPGFYEKIPHAQFSFFTDLLLRLSVAAERVTAAPLLMADLGVARTPEHGRLEAGTQVGRANVGPLGQRAISTDQLSVAFTFKKKLTRTMMICCRVNLWSYCRSLLDLSSLGFLFLFHTGNLERDVCCTDCKSTLSNPCKYK